MKLNKLFLGAIAALASAAMVACSDDAPDNPRVDVPKDGGYIAVNIVAPSGASSRAATEGDFETGSDSENDITSILFVLFNDQNGLYGAYPGTKDSEEKPGSGNIEKIATAVTVIEAKAGVAKPAKFLTIINAPDGFKNKIESCADLNAVRALAADYGSSEKGKFMMSNSIYLENDEEQSTNEIPKLYTNEADAKTNAVPVYVERVVAKITASKASDFADKIDVKLTIQGETQPITLYPEISGYTIANSINKSYAFKNTTGRDIWTTEWAGWNAHSATNKIYRSYWAYSFPGTEDNSISYTNKSWNNVNNGDITGNGKLEFYTQENTTQDATKHTAFLATVTLYNDAAHEHEQSFIKYGMSYYLPESFKTLMANVLKMEAYVTIEGNTISDINDANLELIDTPEKKATSITETGAENVQEFESWAQLTSIGGLKFYQYNGTGDTQNINSYTIKTVEDINKFLAKKQNRCKYWREGKAYYYVPIEHFGDPKTGTMTNDYSKGVVRNHIYKLTLEGISGFGTPVFDPSQIIIPTPPDGGDQFYFLKANINILAWKIVNQPVNFN